MKATHIAILIVLGGFLLLPGLALAGASSSGNGKTDQTSAGYRALSSIQAARKAGTTSTPSELSGDETVPSPRTARAGTIVAVDESGSVYTITFLVSVLSICSVLFVNRTLR